MHRLMFVTAVIVTNVALVPEHATAQDRVRSFSAVPYRFDGDLLFRARPFEFDPGVAEAPSARELQEVPPLAIGQDPADSLYNLARTALIRSDHGRAAELFRELRARFPDSTHVPDSYYWEAFALYRSGSADDLRAALGVLQLQREGHPDAAARGDAPSLTMRINGALAQRGDTEAAELVAQAAEITARTAALVPDQVFLHGDLEITLDTVGGIDLLQQRVADSYRLLDEATQAYPVGDALRTAMQSAQAQYETARLQAELGRAQAEAAVREHTGLRVWVPSHQDNPDCPSNDQETRIAALNAFVQMDADRAVPVLQRVLSRRDPCSQPLRRRAVFLVAQTQAAEAEGVLLNTVQNDPDPEVRRQAVRYLSRIPSERSVQLLQQIVLTADDPGIQEQAVIALAGHEREDGRNALLRFIERDDAPERVRVSAIQHLSRRASERELALLRRSYPRQQSLEIKDAIISALGTRGNAQDHTWIMGLVRNPSEPIELRKRAIYVSGRGAVPLGQLTSLYDQTNATELREQLILTLAQRDEEDATRALERIVRTERNADLQRHAAFWYARTDRDLDALSTLYNDVPSRHVREPLIAAFAQREESAALDKLIEIARSDQEVALRRSAIEWLGRSGDPRALAALLELIER